MLGSNLFAHDLLFRARLHGLGGLLHLREDRRVRSGRYRLCHRLLPLLYLIFHWRGWLFRSIESKIIENNGIKLIIIAGSSTSTSNNVTGECYLNGEVGSVIYSLNDDASTPADPLSYSWSGFPSCSNQTIIFGGAYVPLFCHAEDDGTLYEHIINIILFVNFLCLGTSFTYLPCNETTLSTRTFESSDCTGLYTEGSFNIAGTCSDSSTAVCLASSESTTSSSSTTSSPSTPSSTTSQNQSSTGSFILPSCVLVLVIAALL